MTVAPGGRLGSAHVEAAVIATLGTWLPSYLAASAAAHGITDTSLVPRPRSLITTKDFIDWPSERLPAVQVASGGMIRPPVRDIDGYRAWWDIRVFIIVSARDRAATRRLRAVYEDAVPWALTGHPSLGGLAQATDFLGEAPAEAIDTSDQRTLQGSVSLFSVETYPIFDPGMAPVVPADDPDVPYPPGPTADTVDLTVTPVGLDEEV